MGTWDTLHKEHIEIFNRVNLLEKALIDFLQKRVIDPSANSVDESKDFLNAFEQGIVLHFTVEEKALFPELRKTGKNAETLVNVLLLQHKSIMEKYRTIVRITGTDDEKITSLLEMIKQLSEHSLNEERFVAPLIKQLSLEQLGEVDQAAKQLGYQV